MKTFYDPSSRAVDRRLNQKMDRPWWWGGQVNPLSKIEVKLELA